MASYGLDRRVLLAAGLGCLGVRSVGWCQDTKKPANPPKDRDAAVLEAVLTDLLTCENSPWEPERAGDRRLRFSTEASPSEVAAADVLQRDQKTKWDKLSPGQLAAATEAAEDLVRRTKAREAFRPFTPRDARIVPQTPAQQDTELKEYRDKGPFRRPQVFRAHVPGHYRDGRLALVHLTFPWSGGFHSGEVTYLLTAEKAGWSVLLRLFFFYV